MGKKRERPKEPWTAERIAALRAELGLTQDEFAGEIGVRQQTVSEWETGRYAPRGASAKLLGMLAERAPEWDSQQGTGNREQGTDAPSDRFSRRSGTEKRD